MDWSEILGYAAIALVVVGTPALFVGMYCTAKAKRKKDLAAMAEADSLPEPELVPARVGKTRIHRYWTGSRKWKIYNEEYLITFCTEDGGEITCTVPKETYYAVNEGDSGMLPHTGGNFIDFGEGKECDTAE